MMQKKVCMVGVFGTGKTSLVQRYVYSQFTAKYHSTVGVKIDRKVVALGDASVTLVLWDLAGRDPNEEIPASYVSGSHGVLYVADGTRRDSIEQLDSLQSLVRGAAGDVPSVLALNKADLADEWQLSPREVEQLSKRQPIVRTSAKTGEGVEDTFRRLAQALLVDRTATGR